MLPVFVVLSKIEFAATADDNVVYVLPSGPVTVYVYPATAKLASDVAKLNAPDVTPAAESTFELALIGDVPATLTTAD